MINLKQLEEIVYNNIDDYASIVKILDLLESVKSVKLTKEFVRKLCPIISKELNTDFDIYRKIEDSEMNLIISKFTNLTNIFGWDDLESSLSGFMLPVTSYNLATSLAFIQVRFFRFKIFFRN